VLDLLVAVFVRLIELGDVVITGTIAEATEVDAVATLIVIVGIIVGAEAVYAVALLTVVARAVVAVPAAPELAATIELGLVRKTYYELIG
jgi:hypothetical protein